MSRRSATQRPRRRRHGRKNQALRRWLVRFAAEPDDREAALITFLVTASGMSFLGLSAAFWGLMFGIAAHLLLSVRRKAVVATAPLHTTRLAKEEATG